MTAGPISYITLALFMLSFWEDQSITLEQFVVVAVVCWFIEHADMLLEYNSRHIIVVVGSRRYYTCLTTITSA